MIDTKILGNTTEMECMLECMKLGIQVSIPFGEDSRYDFSINHILLYFVPYRSAKQGRLSSQLIYEPVVFGGGGEVRTPATAINRPNALAVRPLHQLEYLPR